MSSKGEPIWDWKRICIQFRERRKLFGWSLEEAARRAGVSRDTVIRVERGEKCRLKSLHALRSIYGLFSAQLTRHDDSSELFSTCSESEIQWTAATNRDHKGRPIQDPKYVFVNDPVERRRRADLGYQQFFTGFIRCELESGTMNAALMEIYKDSWVDQHFGEEFVYCLSGIVILKIEGVETTLHPGDSIVFDAWRPHQYKIDPVSEIPAKILLFVAKRSDEAERAERWELNRDTWGV